MTREEALFKAKDVLNEATAYENAVCYVTGDDREWLEMAIEALEQVTSYETTIVKLTQAISEQKPKAGRWIEEDMFDGDIAYRCSECDEPFCLIDGTPTDNMYNFCPNCGAKMEARNK